MPPARFRILRFNPAYAGPAGSHADHRAWTQALASFADPSEALQKPAMIKQDGPVTVWRANLQGHEVAVKRWALSSPADHLKALFGHARAHRHWEGAAWLASRQLRTAAPVVLARDRAAPALWLVTEWLRGPTVLEYLAATDSGELPRRRVAQALGLQLAALIRHGRFNRDHKPSNLILAAGPAREDPARPRGSLLFPGVQPSAAGPAARPPAIAIIDCVAIRPIPPGPAAREHAAARMLASLVIEPTGIGAPPGADWARDIADAFARAMEPAGNATLADRLTRRALRLVQRHGDPAPRINPLA